MALSRSSWSCASFSSLVSRARSRMAAGVYGAPRYVEPRADGGAGGAAVGRDRGARRRGAGGPAAAAARPRRRLRRERSRLRAGPDRRGGHPAGARARPPAARLLRRVHARLAGARRAARAARRGEPRVGVPGRGRRGGGVRGGPHPDRVRRRCPRARCSCAGRRRAARATSRPCSGSAAARTRRCCGAAARPCRWCSPTGGPRGRPRRPRARSPPRSTRACSPRRRSRPRITTIARWRSTILGSRSRWSGSGVRSSPSPGLPPLILTDSHGPGGPPGLAASLEYGPLTVDLWPPRAFARFARTRVGRLVRRQRCARTERFAVPGGRATLVGGYAHPPRRCGGRAPDVWFADVELGDVVVAVNRPICLLCLDGGGRYASPAALKAVVAALRRR